MERVLELRNCVDSLSKDAHKFFQKNNRAAGVRARKKLQKCKKLSQEIRIKIQKTKQENVQEKSAEISAMAAVSGGNSLTGENFFGEETILPIQNNFNINPFGAIDFFPPPPNLKNCQEESFNVSILDQENVPFENPLVEPTFYPSFEE